MTNNTSKYIVALDALKSIKHINNMLENCNQCINRLSLIDARESILRVLHYYNYDAWKQLTNASTREEEHRKIDFYISLYELAERARVELFIVKGGDNNER